MINIIQKRGLLRFLQTITGAVLLICSIALAGPEEDRVALRELYESRFPGIALEEHVNGSYALNAGAREQWQSMEEFPPYELAIEEGEELFKQPFANGDSYSTCFPGAEQGIRQDYPYFDESMKEVVTLELAINRCRETNNEQVLPYLEGDIAAISAYLSWKSRGQITQVVIPETPEAQAAYEAGKAYYYARRGQLNFACSSCHVQSAGQMLRAEQLSATLGHSTHWPVYRGTWEAVGTLHKRFAECNVQVRTEALDAQSREYRELEYFLTYMSNGLPLNGPASRR